MNPQFSERKNNNKNKNNKYGTSQIPFNIKVGQENGKEWNK